MFEKKSKIKRVERRDAVRLSNAPAVKQLDGGYGRAEQFVPCVCVVRM